ncbi:uncharacterized protein METZ01_LOCUS240490, partial [marine metagenome]
MKGLLMCCHWVHLVTTMKIGNSENPLLSGLTVEILGNLTLSE